MAKLGKFEFSTREFNRTFYPLTLKKYPIATQKGIRVALQKLKLDADNIPPKTPKEFGDLKSTTSIKTKLGSRKIEGILEYEMPYAAFQHQGIRRDGTHKVQNYTEAGSGPGFVSKKLIRFFKKYMNIIVLKIRQIQGF